MLIKLLGIVDLIAGLILLSGIAFNIPGKLLLIFGLILLAKSLLGMLQDFASWIDFLSGIVLLLLMIINIPQFVIFLFGILLFQKAIFSFVGEF